MSAGRESTNRWIREQAQKLTEELGLSELPMEDSDFDFYRWGQSYLRKNFRVYGQDLADMTYDVITMAFFSVGQGSAVESYRKYLGRPFDNFFKMMFVQKAITTWKRWKSRGERSVGQYAIVPGGGGGGWEREIPEGNIGVLGGLESDVLSEEDREKLLHQEVPRMLAAQRNGEALEKCWGLWLSGNTLEKSVDTLNQLAREDRRYQTAKGGLWSISGVAKLRSLAKELVLRYFGKRDLRLPNLIPGLERPVTFQRRDLLR